MKQAILFFFCIFYFFHLNAQKHYTQTAHVYVESTNNIHDLQADNYQVFSLLDAQTNEIKFTALLKSFEFKIGVLDRIINSRSLDVTQYPKINFEGKLKGIPKVGKLKAGTYDVEVAGILYIWDEKRVTSANGTITIHRDGTISGRSDFEIQIEEKNVEKVNDLMHKKLPSLLNDMDVNTLGISRMINIEVSMHFYKKRP